MKTYNELVQENNELREYLQKVEKWHDEGQELFDNSSSYIVWAFWLGKWWGERPWRKP